MTRGIARWWFLSLLCLAAVVARADNTAPGAGERERIAREKAAVEALYAERYAACQGRFAVTDCEDEAKRQRREALAPLRRQADALEDAQRRRRAAQRLAEIRDRVSAAQAQQEVVIREAPRPAPAAAAPASEEAAASAPVRSAKRPPAPKPRTARAPQPATSEAERRTHEADSQARTEARKASAQAHREAVEARNAERAARGKRAAPLPDPASAPIR